MISTLTEELVRSPWISGPVREAFLTRFDELRSSSMREGNEEGSLVLVAEEKPADFLAALFAALLAGRSVALGNVAWGREEKRSMFNVQRSTFNEAREEGERSMFNVSGEGEVLIPTGGSGGRIRFARHTWGSLCASAEGFGRHFGGGPINSVCVLPLFHVSGLMQVVRAIVSGGEVEILEWASVVAGTIPNRGGEFLSLVPTQLRRLLEVEATHDWLRGLRAIPLGGAAASGDLLAAAAERGFPVALSYGATETAAMVTAQTPEAFLRGDRTCGQPLPHASIRIVDTAGKKVPAGRVGRVCVAGPSLFRGYIPDGGWQGKEWASGDLGFLDEEMRLVIMGREDRIVNTGGEKVSPEEVEGVLLSSGLVRDVWVFGVKDEVWGEALVAAFVPVRPVERDELQAVVRAELAPFKAPKLWVAVEEIPRTVQGKVDRRRLEVMVRETGSEGV